MTHYMDYPTYNQTGLGSLFTYITDVEPMFPIVLIGTLFFISLIASLFAQKRIGGTSDFFTSFVVSSTFIFIVTSLMRYLDMINLYVFSIVTAIFIVSIIILMLPNQREV